MVVKSSLCRTTRQRRGFAVRVFFSVWTAAPPSSRGFDFATDGSYPEGGASQVRAPRSGSFRLADASEPLPAAARLLEGAPNVLRREDQGRSGTDREGRSAQVPPEERRDWK